MPDKYTFGKGKSRTIIAPWREAWTAVTGEDYFGEGYATPEKALEALLPLRGTRGLPPDLPSSLSEWKRSRL